MVSFVEDTTDQDTSRSSGASPDSISVASFVDERKPHMTLSPAIQANRLSSQRVANPYFAAEEFSSANSISATKSSRTKKKKPVFKIRPVKVKFDPKARSITDE